MYEMVDKNITFNDLVKVQVVNDDLKRNQV